jgi:hypothetical protein
MPDSIDRLKLHLDPERAAVHRLADGIWWGDPPERLEIATLRSRRWGNVRFALVALAVLVAALRWC